MKIIAKSLMALLIRVALVTLLAVSSCVQAQISFDGVTRFILHGEQKLITMIVVNDGADTALVQVMLEWGEGGAKDLPLAVSKPLLFIPAYGRASVDILYQGVGLPSTQESYFLIKALVVPKKSLSEGIVNLALQHNLKLFYRPALSSSVESALDGVRWINAGYSGMYMVENDSPYYVTMTEIKFFHRDGRECGSGLEYKMLKPFQAASVSVSSCGKDIAYVGYKVVGDSGISYNRTAIIN